MRVKIDNEVLFIHRDDVPKYNKQGSIVRNSYFWALRSIAVAPTPAMIGNLKQKYGLLCREC